MRKFLLLFAMVSITAAAVTVVDDDGRAVTLATPASRIISTAPHITELLFEAGAGSRIVGITRYSDFPEEARHIPLVGDSRRIDIERVLALKPDLLIAWRGGNPVRQVEQLERLGIPVFYSDLKKPDDIPETMIRFAELAGQGESGRKKAAAWRKRLAQLKEKYSNRPVLKVFYQVSEKPLYTLNDSHIVSEAIRICGGRNIFAGLAVPAPQVGIESVLRQNPEVIFISRSGGNTQGRDYWQRFGILDAVRLGNIYEINPDLTDRPGPRLIEGVEAICERLDEARSKAARH